MLKKHEDAFGQEIYRHLHGEDVSDIIERDDGLVEAGGGPQCYFTEYRVWPQYHKDALKLARGRVLDIGCGAGKHALYLQSKGLNVLGIDTSPLAIKACRERGLRKARVISVSADVKVG